MRQTPASVEPMPSETIIDIDVAWITSHPKFKGFMEAPLDGRYTARSMMFSDPLEESLLKIVNSEEIRGFAVYMAVAREVGGSYHGVIRWDYY
jgi:hypothetical protein